MFILTRLKYSEKGENLFLAACASVLTLWRGLLMNKDFRLISV